MKLSLIPQPCSAPIAVAEKRPIHELNDRRVRLLNPTARYRAGYSFTELEVTVWAVQGEQVYGYAEKVGECFGKLADVRELATEVSP